MKPMKLAQNFAEKKLRREEFNLLLKSLNRYNKYMKFPQTFSYDLILIYLYLLI